MRFKQVSDERFEGSGVAAQFAYMYKTPESLEEKFGITFLHTFDDLDYCAVALLETDDGLLFGLIHHKRAPGEKATVILGNERSNAPREELDQILKALGMDYSEVFPIDEKIVRSLLKDLENESLTQGETSSLKEYLARMEKKAKEYRVWWREKE